MEFWNHLQMQLEHKGFCRVENKKNWYWQEENPVLYLICLLDGAEEGWREENMTFADFAGKMEGSVEEFHCTRVVALSVLVDNQEGILPVDSVETAFQTYDNKLYRVFWHFSPETGRLSAAQGQPTQLLGVEKLLRTGKFLVLYLVSGLCGGVFSVLFSGNAGVSIGASGAIYGLLGAMLLLTKKRGARYTGMNYSTMLLLAATAIGFGFLQEGVDNFAHIGGFLGGIAVFSLLLRKK